MELRNGTIAELLEIACEVYYGWNEMEKEKKSKISQACVQLIVTEKFPRASYFVPASVPAAWPWLYLHCTERKNNWKNLAACF